MPRIANPVSPVRLWVAPPDTRPGGEIGRHNGLKIRRGLTPRTGSIPVPGTIPAAPAVLQFLFEI